MSPSTPQTHFYWINIEGRQINASAKFDELNQNSNEKQKTIFLT